MHLDMKKTNITKKVNACFTGILLFFLLITMSFAYIPKTFAAAEVPFIDNDFVLFWSNPTRAYPDVPLDFRFVVYEKDNQQLTWQLSNAPAGMTIDQNGKVAWTPSNAQTGSYN